MRYREPSKIALVALLASIACDQNKDANDPSEARSESSDSGTPVVEERLYGNCIDGNLEACAPGLEFDQEACAWTENWAICTYRCETLEDCPAEPEGFAIECREYDNFAPSCVIACTREAPVCPTGMTCVVHLTRCVWSNGEPPAGE